MSGLRVLWLGTKEPWPPRDGGRLVAALTVEALTAAGHAVTVVAPAPPAAQAAAPPGVRLVSVAARPRPLAVAALRGAVRHRPWSVERHDHAAVRHRVAELVAAEPWDVVHVEQAQAWAASAPARAAGLPVVLRAQNVESELWRATARGSLAAPFLRRQARRLAAWEGAAAASADAAVALTDADAEVLAALAGRPVTALPAPFPAELPAGPPLAGDPAVVVLGGGWRPNRDGAAWFLAAAWPAVRRELPGATLHLFGGLGVGAPGVVARPAPADSGVAFAAGSLLAVPLRVASGVRMKLLEAWARGVPAVATPAAASGLGATPGGELLVAETPGDLAAALVRLHRDPALRQSLVAAGRDRLRRVHDPATVAARLADVYRSAVRGRATSRRDPTP